MLLSPKSDRVLRLSRDGHRSLVSWTVKSVCCSTSIKNAWRYRYLTTTVKNYPGIFITIFHDFLINFRNKFPWIIYNFFGDAHHYKIKQNIIRVIFEWLPSVSFSSQNWKFHLRWGILFKPYVTTQVLQTTDWVTVTIFICHVSHSNVTYTTRYLLLRGYIILISITEILNIKNVFTELRN